MASTLKWAFGFGAAFLFIIVVIVLTSGPAVPFEDCVGIAQLNGEISYASVETGLFSVGPSNVRQLESQLAKADGQTDVKAILLEIDSPGGSAVPSKELFDAVAKAKKPVVAYFSEVAASGGYYVGAGADYVVADPNTITGSLGARMELLNYAELLQKIGVRQESVQSGGMKDIGAPYRNMTDEEKAILQQIINESFETFRNDVVASRGTKLNRAKFDNVTDGRLLSARMALDAGLVDAVGTRDAALKKAGELAGISGEPKECDLPSDQQIDVFGKLGLSIGRGIASMLLKNDGPHLAYS